MQIELCESSSFSRKYMVIRWWWFSPKVHVKALILSVAALNSGRNFKKQGQGNVLGSLGERLSMHSWNSPETQWVPWSVSLAFCPVMWSLPPNFFMWCKATHYETLTRVKQIWATIFGTSWAVSQMNLFSLLNTQPQVFHYSNEKQNKKLFIIDGKWAEKGNIFFTKF